MKFWERAGLIGGSGFVGGNIARQRPFTRSYTSRTIRTIASERFDTLVCAGAPAVMWAANAHPEDDRRILKELRQNIDRCSFDRLVLVSTIAVLDDMAAGYREENARYETALAYGRNRRELEERLAACYPTTIIRLPALFGPGLKKNYLYDLRHPLPSFIPTDRFEALADGLPEKERTTLRGIYNPGTMKNMMQLQHPSADDTHRQHLIQALEAQRATSKYLTNSASSYQFYDLHHLGNDIDRALVHGIDVLHVGTEPMNAATIHQHILGTPFVNEQGTVVRQDMRSRHADLWGGVDGYLYGSSTVLNEIATFVGAAR
jgi:hypothetical protein